MPRWPLLLPPPAVSISTSPSRSRGSSSSIVIEVESPLCHPSPSSCRRGRAVPRRRAAPSITLYSPSRRPLPPIAFVLSVHRRRARAVEAPSRRPSPSRSRCAVHCRRGAACRLTTPATRHAPPRPLVRMVVALPLLTPPPSICRRLSLQHRLLNLHARIACGTVDAGHFKMNATVVVMRLSACPPLPNMLTKTFHQSESRLCGGGMSNRRSNTLAHDNFASFCASVAS